MTDYKLVPVEPTDEMVGSAIYLEGDIREIWSAMLSAAPEPVIDAAPVVGEPVAFGDPNPKDTPLQAAAREAGWALSSLVDQAPWEKRAKIQAIVERLGSVVDGLEWPWSGDDPRHDAIRDAWIAYAAEHVDDDGRIDFTEIDTCVAIGCMKAFQLMSGPEALVQIKGSA